MTLQDTITASFDVGNWFRPAGKPVFQIKKDVASIDIREGDALLYVKFNTSEKIKLIEACLTTMHQSSYGAFCQYKVPTTIGIICLIITIFLLRA